MLENISTADLLDELRRRITSENKLHFETLVSSKPAAPAPPIEEQPHVDAATQKYLNSIY